MSRGPTRGRVLIFWDYDTQWGMDADLARGLPVETRPGHLEFEHTDRLLELHAEFDVPACFAVVGAAALPGRRPYHDPDQIRRIHHRGHEVASHGYRHEWLPGLDPRRLTEALTLSKRALEQCLGAEVTSFVPPYNQPFDYWPKGSLSLSERRLAGRQRTTLDGLCAALHESGYSFCRVAYRPAHLRIADRLLRRRLDRPSVPERIAGLTCIRLNTPGGFDGPAIAMLRRAAARGGIAVVYGHPHSLSNGGNQDERWLRPFLQEVQDLRQTGGLEVCLPRTLGSGA